MSSGSRTLDLVQQSSIAIQNAVLGGSSQASLDTGAKRGDSGPGPLSPSSSPAQQSAARSVQSIGQTTAIVIQDAGDMLRNISTIETTAIGVATAAWVASEGTLVAYKDIIDEGITIMKAAADLYKTIGTNAYFVLNQFSS
jgi:hypothetical protein